MVQRSVVVILILCSFATAFAQTGKQGKTAFRDSLDGAFDFSDFLMQVNGFVPVPYIITEPAVGGFGGALALVFIRKQPPLIDTVQSSVKIIPTRPTVTGVAVRCKM